MDWTPIRILHLEDEPRDSDLVRSLLESEGMEVEIVRVDERRAYEDALRTGRFELILSDYSLPRFDGPSALELARAICPELPFIFVSGKMGEDLAVESLRHGAMDYVLKNFLTRLPPAVDRTLKEARARKEKARAEWELRSSEAKLAAILENSEDPVWSVDLDARFMTLNTAAIEGFEARLGRRPRAGMRLFDFLAPEAGERWREWLARASSGERVRIELEHSRDGDSRHYEISLNPIRTGTSIIGVAVFSRDVSERRRAESEIRAHRDELEKANARLVENQAQLIQSEKLASLGQLAAGVAHEINNPMSFVTSNLGTLSKYVGAIAPILGECRAVAAARGGPGLEEAAGRLARLVDACRLERILDDIEAVVSESIEGAQRVNEIVQSLKGVARADDGDMEPVDLVECVEDALKLAWNEIKHKCEVVREYSGAAPVHGRPGQLKQVFLNLLINAAQAIPEKGIIRIRAGVSGGAATVEVEDDGAGIGEADLPRIFTPFFTTKPVGQGTGLGLSISYGIVQNHRGVMKVRSETGKGTVFTVSLPAWDGSPPGEGDGGP